MKANHLRIARRIARISVAELARRAGLKESYIRKLEDGVIAQPSYERAVRLAQALDVAPSDLFPVDIQTEVSQ